MVEARGVGKYVDKALELLTVWILAVSAIALIAALAGHFLVPQVLLLGSTVLAGYAWYTKGTSQDHRNPSDWRHLVLLTLVCLLFRLPAYHYVLGGQDEGLYVNIGHHIAQTEGVKVEDLPLAQMGDSPLAKTYLRENRGVGYVPGVYIFNKTDARLEFQFYHLFPVWMAIFASVFGATSEVYALTLLSWLSVIFIYQLALTVSGSRRAALVAGLFLSLNPLHVFFSKFPVTEVPALAFSLIGFTYLVKYRNFADSGSPRRWLWISAMSFGCLFVTRISGFMYMPFIIALAAASAMMDADRSMRRAMFLWGVAVTGLFALSVWYGLHWSSHYSKDIYRLSFERFLGARWRVGVAGVVTLALAAWFASVWMSRSERLRHRMSRFILAPARYAIGPVVALTILAALFKIYQLGWTDRYIHDLSLGERWHLAHAGWGSVEASSLFALLVYLGLLLPAGMWLLIARRQENPGVEFLRVFVSGFLVYSLLLQWIVFYGPYYARYLVSEVVPYLGLFVILVWSGMRPGKWRASASWLLAISLVYMAYASSAQLGKSENDGLYGSLKQLLAPVDPSDLVLMTPLQPGWPAAAQIKTTVVYTFGRTVVSVTDDSLSDRAYISALDARYDDLFLISTSPAAPEGFEAVDSTLVKIWAYDRSFFYPSHFGVSVEKKLYLYRMTRPPFSLSRVEAFGDKGVWGQLLTSGWNTPESWGTWSQGKRAELVIDARQLPGALHGVRLHFEANVLVTPSHPLQRISISLNGAVVAERRITYPQSTTAFDIDVPPELSSAARKLVIGFDLPDAIKPISIGLGSDSRVLALGLKSMAVYPLEPTPSRSAANKFD